MHQLTLSRRLQMIERVCTDAMKLFLDFDSDASLRQAMLRRSRPWRGPYEIGQKVVYWRLRNSLDNEGAQPGYRQGIILAADPGPTGSLWLRNDRGRVVQVAREQVRNLQGDEAWIPGEPDFALLRETEGDLDRKHAVQHDLRDGALPALPAPMHEHPEPVPFALPELPQPVLSPEGQAVDEVPSAQEGVVHDAPLDLTGRPLEPEPMTPQEPIEMDTSSRRPSVAPSFVEPFDSKRQKTESSSASSRRSSFASVPDENLQRQLSHGLSTLPPVPEDDEGQDFLTPRQETQNDPPGAQGDDKLSTQTNLTVHETYTINSKSFFEFCGCLENS